MTDAATVRFATSCGALALGVAGGLAPRRLARLYGTDEPTPEHLYTIRIWAGATAAFGVIGLMEDGLDDRTFLQVGLAIDAFDVLAGLSARTERRSRVMTTGTAVAFGVAAAEGLRRG